MILNARAIERSSRSTISRPLLRYLTKNSTKKPLPFESIPGPVPLPLVGNIWRYLPLIGQYKPSDLYQNGQYNREHYGKIVREQITKDLTILHLFDPNNIEDFLRNDNKWPQRRSHRAILKYRQERPELYRDGGILSENGQAWARLRSQFQNRLLTKPGISINERKMDIAAMQTVRDIERQLDKCENNTITDFDTFLYRWALANALSVFLDVDIDSLDEDEVKQLIEQLHGGLIGLDGTEMGTQTWIKKPDRCPHYQMMAKSEEFLYNFVAKYVDKAYASDTIKETPSSYLKSWIHEDKLDRRDIVAFCMEGLGSMHTASHTMGFFLYYLANNSNHQSLLRKLFDQGGIGRENLDIEQLKSVVLLKDCLKESLRLNPVTIGFGRVTQHDMTIGRYEVPKDIMVLMHNQVIGRDPSIFDDPDRFKPERWAEYRSRPRIERPSSFASLPFGFGPRVCIGMRLAEAQVYALTARLLQNLELIEMENIPTKTHIVHIFDGSFKVKLRMLYKTRA